VGADPLRRVPRVLRAPVRQDPALIAAAGADSALVIVPFADHGFDGSSDGFGAQMEDSMAPSFIAEVTSQP